MKTSSSTPVSNKEKSGSTDRFWNPRFWDGVTMGAWFSALKAGHFRFGVHRVMMGGLISGLSVMNSSLALLQNVFLGRKIRRQELVAPPVFILGHWRSGTTLLHEYMILDDRFTTADTYTCFAPSHFIFSGPVFRPFVGLLMPKKRPMDNMAAGLDRPQEDEFALCVLGTPSPYLNILFPNNPPIYPEYLTLRDISDADRAKWLDKFHWLLKALTVAHPKRILLKSPPHTGRIRTILERFPEAKFVYLHRDPYTLFPSTYNLWMKISRTHGVQIPRGENLREKVFSDFERMDAAYQEDIKLLRDDQLIDISFDELTSSPVETLEKIYEQLQLGDFDQYRQKFVDFAAAQKSYKKNKFEIAPDIKSEITRRWRGYIERYGYEEPKE